MTEELKNKILELKKDLYSTPEFKEYFSLAEQIKNNEDLQEIMKNKKYFQQIDVQKKGQDEYAHSQYLYYCDQYSNHPLIKNFNIIKKEIFDIVNFLKGELSL